MASPEIEALASAFYAAFDNRGSRVPAADDLRALFSETATITRVTEADVASWNPEAFIAPRIAMLTDGTLTEFHEWETDSRTVVLGNIASRWSTYEKAGKLNAAEYRGGGEKFIQLHRTSGRWLISSILWEDRE
jgi:hypothetical protein